MVEQQKSPQWDQMRKGAYEILNVRSEISKRQSRSASLVENIGRVLAYPMFFFSLLSAHLIWILLNLPIFPWFEPWDPYPFAFLATFTSAEAPIIALLVLMYQRRNSRISELREEIDLQVSFHLEQQMSVMLRLLDEVQEKLGVASREDRELLERLRREMDPKELMQGIRRHLQQAEDSEAATAP